ncbi:MAG: hypothetical protein GY951_09190 [Psychromonas sp.]|nr:hypothetical protein [Psychromonas sp.]
MNSSMTRFSFTTLLAFTSYINAAILPSSISEGSIALDVNHTHSNNIQKSSSDQAVGYEQYAELRLGYKNQTTTNTSLINYGITYSHYSEKELENESDISGSLSINQQLFSKNLQLDLTHFRHSYRLDQNSVNLPGNTGSRDVFTVSPLWRLPYSDRAGFNTRYTYTAVRLRDDRQQDTNRNGLSIAWYYALNSKITYQLNTQYNEVDYLADDLTYEQINVDISLSGRLRNGHYLINAGYSRLALLERYEDGGIFQFTYNYRFKTHTLSVSALRELTDSSLGLGIDTPDSGDLDYNGTQRIWIDRVSLDHSFFAINGRLINNNTAYYQQDTPLMTREAEPRVGISTAVHWKHTHKLTTGLQVEYSQTQIDKDTDNQEWSASLSSEYRLNPRLAFSLTTQYEEPLKNEYLSGYDETRLTATVHFSY